VALPQFTPALEALATAESADTYGFWYGDPAHEGQLGPWNTLRSDGPLGPIFPGAKDYTDPKACGVRVRGKVAYRVDHPKIKKSDGHRLVIEGYQPDALEIEVWIWTPAQYAAYLAVLPLISPKLNPVLRRAHRISHADLAPLGLSEVYFTEVPTLEDGHVWGLRVLKLKAIEVFRDAKESTKVLKPSDDYTGPLAIPEGRGPGGNAVTPTGEYIDTSPAGKV